MFELKKKIFIQRENVYATNQILKFRYQPQKLGIIQAVVSSQIWSFIKQILSQGKSRK